jgi:hypothetical protein
MATETQAAGDGPDPAGAIVPPRNSDGTPGAPDPDPHDEANLTDEAADAVETDVEAGDEIPQP